MAVKGIVSKGVPTNKAQNTVGVLRYLPTPRNPATPYQFHRQNLTDSDLTTFWNQGRYQDSPRHTMSGYNGESKRKIEDVEVPMIPRKQLEKFMPNIDIGAASYVTPTSLMSARSGHRVTHDMLHSYDKYIGGMGPYRHAQVDHDNISKMDPNRVGLHPDTISSRARMFRWFRRGPFFNENHYFIRSALRDDGFAANPMYARVEGPLHVKIIRLANEGHFKSACEEYRRLAFIPPVEVFRALTAACIPGAQLADALEILADATHRLRYVARDFEVFRNVMLTAIAADNADRVMWLINNIEGTFTENVIIRASFTKLEKFDLYQRALEFLLDKPGTQQRAREVYNLMSKQKLFNCDIDMTEGAVMRQNILAALEKGGGDELAKINLSTSSSVAASSSSLNKAAKDALEIVAKRMFFGKNEQVSSTLRSSATLGTRLRQIASDIDVLYVIRLCRFLETEGSVDLLADKKRHDEFAERAEDWILQLSENCRNYFSVINNNNKNTSSTNKNDNNNNELVGKSLPYLPKSRASQAINGNGEYIRIAIDPLAVRSSSTSSITSSHSNSSSSSSAPTFHYQPSQRFVEETYPSLDVDNASSKYLVRQPIHHEKVLGLFPENINSGEDEVESPSSTSSSILSSTSQQMIIHSSISPDASRYIMSSSSNSNSSSSSQQQQQEVKIDPSMEGHL